MKKIVVLVLGLFVVLILHAQDIIITTDAQKIDAKIIEVSKSEIKYKELDNIDGPIFVLETSDINSIIYSTGKVVVYNQSKPQDSEQQAEQTPTSQNQHAFEKTDVSRPNKPDVDSLENLAKIALLSGDTLFVELLGMNSAYVEYTKGGVRDAINTSQIQTVTLSNGQVRTYNETPQPRRTPVSHSQQEVIRDTQPIEMVQDNIYYDWNNWLDYIMINKKVDINNYKTIYLYPVDESNVTLPEKTDNQYPALVKALQTFPYIIRKKLENDYQYLRVIVVENNEQVNVENNALVLKLRFDEFNMGSRALRVWIGFGAGAQSITISGDVIDSDNNVLFSFKHKRISLNWKTYEKCLKAEFSNFADDISRIFEEMSKEH